MFKINISLHHCLLVFAAFFALDTFELTAAKDPLTRLQDSFGAPPAVRRKIYAEVIRLSGPAETDSIALLARAVALQQRAMDLEDEYIDRMIKTAPAFSGIERANPPFLPDYRRAADEFATLQVQFPFSESYGKYARLVARFCNDGTRLYQASLSFRRNYPLSRFIRRLLLLSGSRLLLEKNYPLARECFETLWRDTPESSQAVKGYRLVNNLGNAGGLELTPQQILAWGRSQGLNGHSALVRLIERFPASPESELAYLQIFKNTNRGFPQRSLSRNFRHSDLFEKHFNRFTRDFPHSAYLPEALILRAEFNYRCGKKSQAIARKNDNTWRRTKSSSRQRISKRYASYADKYFTRLRAADSTAAELFPRSRCYFETGLFAGLSLLETDNFSQALARLKSLLAQGPDPLTEVRIRSYAGLINYHEGRYPQAVKVLAPAEKRSDGDRESWSRMMLFLGKSYLVLGDSSSAARVFASLSRLYPYTYHGIRARLLKNGLVGPLLPKWIAELPLISLPSFPEGFTSEGRIINEQAESWQSLGFFTEAAYIYTHGVASVPEDFLLRFRYHENFRLAGWYHYILRNFRGPFNRILQRGGMNLPENFWQIAYLNPEDNVETIKREGKKRNIPFGLITAVIRQESNFNPRARSHAGAVGLMQLLPSIGRRLASSMGLGRITTSRLYNPQINIKLGVKFLANNLSKYNGNIALAISSYNADPRNLPAWLERSHPKGSDDFDLDLFIELIPLEETYNYNIQVLTNFWRYQELNGEEENLFSWRLPAYSKVN